MELAAVSSTVVVQLAPPSVVESIAPAPPTQQSDELAHQIEYAPDPAAGGAVTALQVCPPSVLTTAPGLGVLPAVPENPVAMQKVVEGHDTP
jgi:hypothetical protein